MAYHVGSLADLISGTRDASCNESIIYVPAEKIKVTPTQALRNKYDVVSRKNHQINNELLTSSLPGENESNTRTKWPEAMQENLDDARKPAYPPRRRFKKNELNEETESRTIIVKNIPYSVTLKQVKKYFSEYGAVESLRFRCAPRDDLRVPKKVAVIKKKFHPERTNICAFVRFKDIETVEEALQANGSLFHDYRIFVDRALNKQKHDQRKAIFLGNVPFDAEENDLWNAFEKCGKITDIRIIRDRNTSLGKGFAFINFESSDGVELAVSLNGVKLKEKELRVCRATNKLSTQQKYKMISSDKKSRRNFNQESSRRNKHSWKKNDNAEMESQSVGQNYVKVKKNPPFLQSGGKEQKERNMPSQPFQGQRVDDKKKKKKKLNKTEIKKMIIAKKLTNFHGKK